MNQSVLTLTPGGLPLAQSLGFEARSAIVDNYTSAYAVLPDAGKTIPPWCYGATVALPPGLRRATVSLVPTVPAVTGPPVPTVEAITTWTDAELPPDPGHLLQSSAYALRQDLGIVTSPANGGQTSQSFVLPAGTTSVGLIMDFSVSGNPAQLTMHGDQTQEPYASLIKAVNPLLGDFSGGAFVYQIAPRDTSVTVTLVSGNPGAACVVRVIAYLDEASVYVQQNRGSFFNVSHSGSVPAGWQAAVNRPTQFANTITLGAANALNLIGGVAGKTIYLHLLYVAYDVTGAAAKYMHISDGDPNAGGTTIADIPLFANPPPPYEGHGAPFQAGNGLYLWTDATILARGSVIVSQV